MADGHHFSPFLRVIMLGFFQLQVSIYLRQFQSVKENSLKHTSIEVSPKSVAERQSGAEKGRGL